MTTISGIDLVGCPFYDRVYLDKDLNVYKDIGIKKSKIVKAKIFESSHGYFVFNLAVNKKQKTLFVHRIIACTLIPNPQNKPHINHIDGNKKNNKIENLEWCTPKENSDHAIKNGLLKRDGADNPATKRDTIDCLVARTFFCLFYRKNKGISYLYTKKELESFRHGWKQTINITKEEITNERSKYGNDFIKR